MKSINRFFLDIENKLLTDEITTPGGVRLYVDPEYDPTHYQKIKGTLVFPCVNFPEVPVSATIYFHYLCSSEDNMHLIDDKRCLIIESGEAFCYVVDGKITMLNDNVFVKPVKFSAISHLSPATIARLNLKGISSMTEMKKSASTGVIAYSDSPGVAEVGWSGVFKEFEAFENNIEGEDLYVMKADCFFRIDDMLENVDFGKEPAY